MATLFPYGVKYYLETELLDYALTLGMTPEEYWCWDPHLLDNYEQAFKSKSQIKTQDLWLQGLYFKSALNSTVLIAGLADKKITSRMPKYADNPMKYNSNGELTDEEVEAQRKAVYRFFKSLKPRG